MRKIFSCFLLLFVLFFTNFCYASNMEFQAFIAQELVSDEACVVTTRLAVAVYKYLGYTNSLGGNVYKTTAYKSDVLSYVNTLGNNFGFFIMAHGNTGTFTTQQNNSTQYIYTSNISGYWHLVFINSCKTLSNNSMAQAFKTVGYSKRATMGWYDTVTSYASAEWWTHFSEVAGTTNLRSACLSAADQCIRYTPIRIFGDTTWNGRAF